MLRLEANKKLGLATGHLMQNKNACARNILMRANVNTIAISAHGKINQNHFTSKTPSRKS